MKPADREEFFRRLRAANPAPRTELEYTTPFELLVAVILSAQTTDRSVNVATRGLFSKANTPRAMLALGVEGLARHIRSIGLYQGKVRNIIATSKILVEQYRGEVPADRAALEALPGVGRKTANVILNVAFGVPTIAVDSGMRSFASRITRTGEYANMPGSRQVRCGSSDSTVPMPTRMASASARI